MRIPYFKKWFRFASVCLLLILSIMVISACNGSGGNSSSKKNGEDGQSESEKYIKIYYNDGCGNTSSASVLTTATLEQPDDPEREGYTFLGWYLEDAETAYDFTQPVGDVSFTLYAHWEPIPVSVIHKVSYYYNDGTDLVLVKIQRVDEAIGFTEELLAERDAIRYEGFGFGSYYSDQWKINRFSFKAAVTSDVSVYCSRDDLAGPNVHWDYIKDTQTLSLTGSGEMYDFRYYTSVPWNNLSKLVAKIEIEEGITTIGDCSFYGFKNIDKVTLPESIVTIGENAFYQSSISDINFPDALRTIKSCAFQQCQNLIHLNFNEGLAYIGQAAFYECSNICTAVLTDTIGELGGAAFQENTNLKSVYYIGTEEQYSNIKVRLSNFWLTDLARTYFIKEEKPTTPGPFWYYNDKGEITQWYYTVWYMESTSSKLPAFRDFIDAVDGVSQDNIDNMKQMYHGYRFAGWKIATDQKLKKFQDFQMTVGQKVTEDFRVYGVRGNLCGENLTFSIVSQGNKKILKIDGTGPMWDFEEVAEAPWVLNAGMITEVSIGSGVTYIGSHAFYGLLSVEQLYIPTNITGVSKSMITNCAPLKYIFYEGDSAAFAQVANLNELESVYDAVVYVHSPDGENPGEGNYWRVLSRTSGTDRMTKTVTWSLHDGKLTVGCSDTTMFNYLSSADTPWYAEKDNITSVAVRNGIKVLGHNTFNGLDKVTAISLPASLTRISASALEGTAYYNDPENRDEYGVLYIDHHLIRAMTPDAMPTCYTIQRYTLSIAENAFEGCSNVKSIVFGQEMDSIYSTGMSGLTSLENIYFTSDYSVWKSQNGRENLCSYTNIYFYSLSKPTDTEHQYWYYGNDGLPAVWEE